MSVYNLSSDLWNQGSSGCIYPHTLLVFIRPYTYSHPLLLPSLLSLFLPLSHYLLKFFSTMRPASCVRHIWVMTMVLSSPYVRFTLAQEMEAHKGSLDHDNVLTHTIQMEENGNEFNVSESVVEELIMNRTRFLDLTYDNPGNNVISFIRTPVKKGKVDPEVWV